MDCEERSVYRRKFESIKEICGDDCLMAIWASLAWNRANITGLMGTFVLNSERALGDYTKNITVCAHTEYAHCGCVHYCLCLGGYQNGNSHPASIRHNFEKVYA